MRTQAKAAKAAVIALLRADAGLAGVTVLDRPVTDATQEPELVYYDRTAFTQNTRGPGRRDDEFTIALVVLLMKIEDPGVLEDRCWDLVGAIQDAISADPSLGGAVNVGAEVSDGSVEPAPATPDGGWQVRGEVSVRCRCVIA